MRRLFAFLVFVGAAVLALGGAAHATVIFTLGNNPQTGEENIQFETAQTGNTITGDTVTSNIGVLFTSTQTLATQGLGQASFNGSGGASITSPVTFSVPGYTFQDYIFDAHDGTGTATVTVQANDGLFTDSLTLGNGENFLTITTADNEVLSWVTISAPDGFTEYDQPRVSGLAPVPEPSTLLLLGSGLAGLGGFTWRRRRG